MRNRHEVKQALEAINLALRLPPMQATSPETRAVYKSLAVAFAWVLEEPWGEEFGKFIDYTIASNGEEAEEAIRG